MSKHNGWWADFGILPPTPASFPPPGEQHAGCFTESLLSRPAHVIRATWGCVCLPGLAYWYVCSQTTADRSRMSGWPKLIQKLSPRTFLLGCRTGRNGAWSSRGEGACLGACQEDRARAKDTHRPWDTPESSSPAAALQHSIPGPLVLWASGSLTSPFSQLCLALSAPWEVLANVRCFLISSHLNKNEKHQEHNVNYFCQKKDKQLHHISKPTEISFPILTIFINPLIK